MLLFSITWVISLVYAATPNAIYYKRNCLDEFISKFARATDRAEACATMLLHGLPCVDTMQEKLWFLETFDNGTCSFLSHLITTEKPAKTKRGVLDWLDSMPHQQGTLPETMHKIWSYHAEKLKSSSYRSQADEARAMSRHYARRVEPHDTSSASIRKWSAFACLMIMVGFMYLF